jgi:hypothetical protein
MTSFTKRRKRLGSVVAVALGALAIFVLPGLATARDNSSGPSSATIKSFDAATRTLVVSLPEGETVTGLVTWRTKVRCEDQRGDRGHHHGDDRVRLRDSGPGHSGSGSGEAEPGDDHGGHGEEPGDDNGGHGEEPGDDNGGGRGQSGEGGHDDNGRGANCTTADLIPGAAVDEVELDFDHGGVRFDEVELSDNAVSNN